ncbi:MULTISPECIES: hypothetical protein [Streptomyces]|uniref:hypothetical protein n=1 Tax=Streptomyces TaxID=1883 RepID=UPI00117D3207|nr:MULTISPECIES: hypothetical protein [Streptomyces]
MAIINRFMESIDRRNHHGKPYDRVVLDLISIAGKLHQACDKWRSDKDAQNICREIESVARAAQYLVSSSRRLDDGDINVRIGFRNEADRIAEGIREHKHLVARSYSPEACSEAARSLASAAAMLAEGDMISMLAHCPEPNAAPPTSVALRPQIKPLILLCQLREDDD